MIDSVKPKPPLVGFIFGTIVFIALLLRLAISIANPNILWPDEIFQSLEQAHRLAYGYGVVPWEFREGTRSWVLPGILAGVMRLTDWIGDGSSGYLIGVTIFLCLLSLLPVLIGFLWGYRTNGLVGAIITAIVCSVWFELIYFAPKALTEVLAAHFLLAGVYLGVYSNSHKRSQLFFAGCLCGTTIALRIHLLPAVIVAAVFICRRDRRKWLHLITGILLPILVFGLVDAFTWSYPFQSLWKNAWVNVVEDKSSQFGVSPWYGYVFPIIKNWSLAVVPMALLAFLGARRSPILAWIAIVILLTHSAIAHKEYRFIYPAILIAIVLAGLGCAELVTRLALRRFSNRKAIASVLICLVIWTSLSTILATRYGSFESNSISMLWSIPNRIRWKDFSGNLLAFKTLSTEQTLCGVGVLGITWFWTGGYTYLHRNVPIFQIEKKNDFDKFSPSFNYLVSTVPVPSSNQNYTVQKCWGETCLYKRPNSCTQIKGYSINKVLEQRGE